MAGTMPGHDECVDSRLEMTEPEITPRDLKARLDPLLAARDCEKGPLAVAVSGGGDSMALLLLAHEAYPGRVTGLTVDHGLRSESAAEAAQIASWANARAIPHCTFCWDGAKPRSAIQARARDARYRLLAEGASALGVPDRPAVVLTAHTAEDQRETIVMRAAHGSGPAGLAGMRAASEIAGAPPVVLLRPLLSFQREQLRDVLRARGQAWFEDPSNDDLRFERVRVRRALAAGGTEWAEAEDDTQDNEPAADPLRRAVEIRAPGFARLGRTEFVQTESEVAERIMRKLLHGLGGGAYPPKRAEVEELIQRMRAPEFRGATLAGCRIAAAPGQFTLFRELRNSAAAPIRPGESLLWDRRFFVACPVDTPGEDLTIRPLGAAAAAVRAGLPERLPSAAVAALPGLWRGQNLVTPILPAGLNVPGGPNSLFVGLARVESCLTSAWRTWCTMTAPTVS